MDVALAGQIIVWIIIGGFAGSVASMIVRGRRRGFGVLSNIVIGLIGAFIGGIVFQFFNITIPGADAIVFSANDLIAAIAGSLILLFVLFVIRR